MTDSKRLQRYLHWEQLRFALTHFSAASRAPKFAQAFQHGDIATCKGSIEAVFYQILSKLGIRLNLQDGEIPALGVLAPYRYCVINRHVVGQFYEVFLLTTFGGARNYNNLDSVAQYFAMPMGSTKWTGHVSGISTIPRIFGMETPSFLFALPTIQMVPPRIIKARVPESEMRRIANYSKAKELSLLRDHWRLRTSMANRRFDKYHWSGDDTFAPVQEQIQLAKLDDDGPFVKPYRSQLDGTTFEKTLRSPLAPYNDIRWLSRHAPVDITNASRYLNQTRALKPQRLSVPKPYYANCLRVIPSKIRQLV